LSELQGAFLSILPWIELHGRCYFRHKRRDHQDESIAEMVALSWKWFVRLAEKGKDATAFPSVLATYAAKAVNNGRRLCGQEKPKDVLSPTAQRLQGFTISPLPEDHGPNCSAFNEVLFDNTRTPVPEQVSFRLDFPAWRLTRCERDRRLIDDLMMGERTKDVADRYGLTAGRISQLRRDFQQDWTRFCGEAENLPS
jgi:hypothetical protein